MCDLTELLQAALARGFGLSVKGKVRKSILFGSEPAVLISIPNSAAADWMDTSLISFLYVTTVLQNDKHLLLRTYYMPALYLLLT